MPTSRAAMAVPRATSLIPNRRVSAGTRGPTESRQFWSDRSGFRRLHIRTRIVGLTVR